MKKSGHCKLNRAADVRAAVAEFKSPKLNHFLFGLTFIKRNAYSEVFTAYRPMHHWTRGSLNVYFFYFES